MNGLELDFANEYANQKLRELFEMSRPPWWLSQSNSKGVEVKDSCGVIVYAENFDFPDEMKSGQREDIINRAMLIAQLLVALSETKNGYQGKARG